MTRNIKFALFYMFLHGFCVAIVISMLVQNSPIEKILIMFVTACIILATAVSYYKKFTRDNDRILRPTKDGW